MNNLQDSYNLINDAHSVERIEELFDDNFIAALSAGMSVDRVGSEGVDSVESGTGIDSAEFITQPLPAPTFNPPKHTTFKCHSCDKTFATQWNLDRHNTQHTGDKEFKCGTCGKEFALKDKYQQHLKRGCGGETAGRALRCTCEVCGKELADKSSLKKHQETHNTSRKRYKCPICALSYTRPRLVRLHIHKNHMGSIAGVDIKHIPIDGSVHAFIQSV